MPKIEQLDWDNLKPKTKDNKKNFKESDAIYWRYKKQTAPEPTSDKHGEVKPSFFTCSKCKVNTGSRASLKEHWDIEH